MMYIVMMGGVLGAGGGAGLVLDLVTSSFPTILTRLLFRTITDTVSSFFLLLEEIALKHMLQPKLCWWLIPIKGGERH